MDNLIFIDLAEAKQPKFVENKNKDYVSYGEANDYPTYLLDLLSKAAKHGAIVKGKTTYIAGEGWTGGIDRIGPFGQNLNAMTRGIAMDLETFGGFYLEVVWDMMGRLSSVRHVDYCRYRSNKDNTTFYYKEDWSKTREKEIAIPGFNPRYRIKKQILYYKSYTPGAGTYAVPGYTSALNYICAEIEVGKHVYNNSLVGFTPSKLINFNNGEPTDEEKEQLERAMKKKFTGANGWKFILSFNKGPEVAPTILDLGASDLTKEDFTAVDNLISENIFTGHQITSPMLFGIRVAGQLGGTTEMIDSFEIFKNTYVSDKQRQIEQVINMLAAINGMSAGEIIPVNPVKDKPAPMTAPALPFAPAAPAPQQMADQDEDFQLFEEYGVPKDSYNIVRSKPFKFIDQENTIISEMAEVAITRSEAAILDMIKKDPRITPEVLSKALLIDISEVREIISSLEASGKLKTAVIKIGPDEVIERTVPAEVRPQVSDAKPYTREIGIKYSYEAKPGVGDPVIPTTRPFCRKLIQLNRLYTRKEIEAMSVRLGYNVFERKGGWWGHGPGQPASPECRHRWMQHVVIKTTFD